MMKFLIFSFFLTLANAQELVRDPVVIKNEDFKDGVTIGDALDQIYKRVIPKKSTKDPATCFWMLGDNIYLIVVVGMELEIEPLLLEKLVKLDEDGAEYLVNKNERSTAEDLKKHIRAYHNLAKSSDVDPIVMLVRNETLLSENLKMLKLIQEQGVKHIYLTPPVRAKVASPVIALPKKPPASPHRK